MNNRKPRHLTLCKFPGMTRAEYDVRLNEVKALCNPMMRLFRPGPALNANGLPGITNSMLQTFVKKLGASAFSGGMYRTSERSKTGIREAARRLRQRGTASA